jgi:predicted transport protein
MKFADVAGSMDNYKDIIGVGRWDNGDVKVDFESLDQLNDVMALIEHAFQLQDDE